MAFTGIQPIIAFYISKKTIKLNTFLLPIIIGILLPDIDVIFALFGTLLFKHDISLYLFTNKATHSFIIILLFYLGGLILKEITKQQKPIVMTQGIMIGITIHIIFDIIFSNQNIYILWPLNQSFNILGNLFILDNYTKFLQVFDFLFFRFYGWYLIKQLILKPSNNIIWGIFKICYLLWVTLCNKFFYSQIK